VTTHGVGPKNLFSQEFDPNHSIFLDGEEGIAIAAFYKDNQITLRRIGNPALTVRVFPNTETEQLV